jgi:hypothetical protein
MHSDAVLSSSVKVKSQVVPLELEENELATAELDVSFLADKKRLGQSTLRIHWGPFLLTAPVSADFGSLIERGQ